MPSADPAPFTIPVINIAPYLSTSPPPTPETKSALASQLQTACSTSGFFQITGVDALLSPSLQTRYLSSIKNFFSTLPASEKSRISFKNSACNRGYEALGGQKLDQLDPNASVDQKEGFSIRGIVDQAPGPFLAGANLWPREDLAPGFRHTTEEYFTALHALSKAVFRLLALSLSLHEGYFDGFAADPADRKLRCHHYPPTAPDPTGRVRGVGAHTDFGAITLLLQDEVGGLEVLDRATGTWHLVPPTQGAYVVNLGDLMQRWTNDRYLSTMHRVLAPLSGKDRYSAAFFNDGPLGWVIACLPGCEGVGGVEKYRPIRLEEHLLGRYRGSYDVAGERTAVGGGK